MKLDFDKLNGLLPVVVQELATGEVLMVGFMNRAALRTTFQTGELVFYSRSRQQLWKKGEESGHELRLRELRVDCDQDTLLARVEALGPGVCHKGYRTCFHRQLDREGTATIIEEQSFDPIKVYGKGKQA